MGSAHSCQSVKAKRDRRRRCISPIFLRYRGLCSTTVRAVTAVVKRVRRFMVMMMMMMVVVVVFALGSEPDQTGPTFAPGGPHADDILTNRANTSSQVSNNKKVK